jgi:hypothetical protein
MKRLHFVSSGNAAFSSRLFEDERLNTFLIEQTQLAKSDLHDLTYLFNAYTEKSACKNIAAELKKHTKIYLDSGGLQVITLGKPLTEEIKQKVYEYQALYSDYGFCFDEIPLDVGEGGSSLLTLNDRIFNRSKVEGCAKTTALNIIEQVKVYQKMESACRPIVIIQGNDYSSFMKFAEVIENTLPEEIKGHIGGLAMAGTSLGRGTLQDLERTFYFNDLPLSFGKKHLHLLAVGSVRRLAPTLLAMQTGFYDKDMLVSYDASTISKHLFNGLFHNKDSRLLSIKKSMSKHYMTVHNELSDMFDCYDYSLNDLFELNNTAMSKYASSKEDGAYLHKKMLMYRFFGGVKNFIALADRALMEKDVLRLMFEERGVGIVFDGLYSIKTLDDFRSWERHMGRHVDSSRIPSVKQSTLEGFFE